MLKDSFYFISDLQSSATTLTATLQLNPEHPIFEGHFPNQPVVPGVCLMQMVKEVLEIKTDKLLMLAKADYLKFISPVIPDGAQELVLQVKYNALESELIKAVATLTINEASCFKLQGYFQATNQ